LADLSEHRKTWDALGIDEKFMTDLIAQKGDTQFIVGLAVVVEGAAAIVLQKNLNANEDFVEWVMKKTKHSERLHLLKILKKIDSTSYDMLLKLAEIRNAFAHQPANLKKSLEQFYTDQKPQWKYELQNALAQQLVTDKSLLKNFKSGDIDDACLLNSGTHCSVA